MGEPARTEVEGWAGVTVLEFGASWCPICDEARPGIDRALATVSHVRHVWVEDGPGLPLGRSFRVKLWPTLVLLRDGQEVGRVVRPETDDDLRDLMALAAPGAR